MKRKLFAQIAIALLLVSIFSVLPVATTPPMFSAGKVEAVRFDIAEEGLFSGMSSATKPKLTFNLDMIDVENVNKDGEGIYVAVIDTGLLPTWRHYFPEDQIVRKWATAFFWDERFKTIEVPEFYEQALSGHGTHVTSTVIGYNFLSGNTVQIIDGVAPKAKIIPIKVLWWFDQFGTSVGTAGAIEAGIDHVTELIRRHKIKVVINLSLGASVPIRQIEKAIDKAIKAGAIVVAAAGNAGTAGMDWPGAYPQVISAAWAGWTGQWFGGIDPLTFNPLWDLGWHRNDVPEDLMTPAPSSALFGFRGGTQVYISGGSGRELPGQDLDVAAPGSWVFGPFWFPGWGPLPADPRQAYAWVSGTSMASPHTAGTAALMLDENPSLSQSEVEMILESTADLAPITFPNGGWLDPNPYMAIYALHPGFPAGWYFASWDNDAVGQGFLDADSAVEAA